MKSVIIAAALMALSILPVNAKAANFGMDENKPKIIITEEREKTPARSPDDYYLDMDVESINNTLCIIFTGWGFGMVFTLFLKDNEHIVIAIENNEIIVCKPDLRFVGSFLPEWFGRSVGTKYSSRKTGYYSHKCY